jgi:hypothetical protein
MDWFFFAALGILWAAFLLPTHGRRRSPATSVEEFEKHMELLENTERHEPGRWLLAPKKGEPFIGARERQRMRVRQRRRVVFTVLLEAMGISFLIGLFPPLRAMWFATGALVVIQGLYCTLLVHYRKVEVARRESRVHPGQPAAAPPAVRATALPASARPATSRPAPSRPAPSARPARPVREVYNGLGSLGDGDKVHVIVRLPEELSAVNA